MAVPLPPRAAVSESVCVSVAGLEEAVGAPAVVPDRLLTHARAALARGVRPAAVPHGVLVDYVPLETPTSPFDVRAAAALDGPDHGWLVVQAGTPPGHSEVPLKLTVLLDVSDSMSGVPTNRVPVLQDQGPDEEIRNVSRLALARGVLASLVEQLPERAELSVVAFDRSAAAVVLRPTRDRQRMGSVVLPDEGPEPGDSALDLAYTLAADDFDPCDDHRVLLITDDNARLALDPQEVADVVSAWAELGVELWTLSLGTGGRRADKVEALTAAGRGTVIYADTLSQATGPLRGLLAASGAAARGARVTVRFAEGVRARRLDDSDVETDVWALPDMLPTGWGAVAVYELDGIDAGGVVATVDHGARSAIPGAWEQARALEVSARPLSQAEAAVRQRVFALAVADGLAGLRPWDEVIALGPDLVGAPGPALELATWAQLASEAR